MIRRLAGLALLAAATGIGCGPSDAPPQESGSLPQPGETLRLDYGPILRSVDTRSARLLFRASRRDGPAVPWTAGVEISALDGDGRGKPIRVPEVRVTSSTDFVAHIAIDGLEPQTRYGYVPLIDGRRAFDRGRDGWPSFTTPPDLDGRNADFTVAFLADQHAPEGPDAIDFDAYAVAADARPLFWAQLGDVASGSVTPGQPEEQRTREQIEAIWHRNYGDRESPQTRLAASYPLNLATISDHELMDNFSMNWHRSLVGGDESATLHDRVARYDRSIRTWWNYLGWGPSMDRPLGRAALDDRGESTMAEAATELLEDVSDRTACVADAFVRGLRAGSFVHLTDGTHATWNARIGDVAGPGSCGEAQGTPIVFDPPVPQPFLRSNAARLAIGASYAQHGHYHEYRPFPFVEFFVLDTTSYRGDPYQERELYSREANRDPDHSRYPWNSEGGRLYIFGDREHGANRTTDTVRSWLGPAQKQAFLEAVRSSDAQVVVIAAGYSLYSAKFEWSDRYWEARESGFDFATELDEIVSVLEGLDKLVLWVHGDGHTPMLVRLRPNLYQLQIGPTLMRHTENPGHRSRTLSSGDRSGRDSIGGGEMIAGHQPDLKFGDDVEDFFAGHLDQFEGYMRLYFHPGREALRNSDGVEIRRGATSRIVEIPAASDPARGAAARHIVGRVVRLEFGDRRVHSIVTSYRHENGRAVIELRDPVATEDPDLLRVLLDDEPWVEARWFDSRGREWKEFGTVLRRAPRTR